jgi:hypothetical protein
MTATVVSEFIQTQIERLKTTTFLDDNNEESKVWDMLKPHEQLAYQNLNITLSEVAGSCTERVSCYHSSGALLYNVSTEYMLTEDSEITTLSMTAVCIGCVRYKLNRLLFKNFIDLNWWSMWRHEELLINKDFFARPDYELPECKVCHHDILPADKWTQGNMNTNRLLVTQEDTDYTMHKNCATLCYECDAVYASTHDMTSVDNHWLCAKCFADVDTISDCNECGTYTTDDTIYSSFRDSNLCQSCYDTAVECPDCNEEYYEDDGHDCEEEDNGPINSYSYKPRPVFYGNAKYYLGFELEVESGDSNRRTDNAFKVIEALGNRIYLKEDGSLSHGFEIVSHPHSLDEYHNKFDWSILTKLRARGVRSWNTSTCGLHVHVSRTAFDTPEFNWTEHENHLIRFNKFIYDNQVQVEQIAGRSNNNYASFSDKGRVIKKIKGGYQNSNRYSAVNIQPEKTVEIRVFKGSLRIERVLSGIEFTHAAVEYTRHLKIVPKSKPFSWAHFVGFVSANVDTYPNLFTIINEVFKKETQTIEGEN